MRKTVYYQREAADPILENSVILDIVRRYAPEAEAVTHIDESGGEGRVYAVDENIMLKVQRPHQLRSSTSLEKEAFFLKQLEKETDVNVPRVLGYGKDGTVEYLCITRIPGIAAEHTKLIGKKKNNFLHKLGKELRKIHSINQKPFLESGLFPHDEPSELTERLLLRYQSALSKKKDIVRQDKLDSALCEIQELLDNIQNAGEFVSLHINPYIPHVFVDEKTLEYSGIIDFGDSYIGHPIFDMWYWSVPSRKKLLSGYTSEKPVSTAFQTVFDTAVAISEIVNDVK